MFYLIYIAFACFLLWPALLQFGQVVPGAEISDLWNSLWSIHFTVDSFQQGNLPTCTALLNYPKGGCLWPSDIVGAILALPFLSIFSLVESYTLVLVIQWSVIGIATDRLFRLLYPQATNLQSLLSGFMMMTSAVVSTAVHNGSSEAMSMGWSILAMVGIVQWSEGKKRGLFWLFLCTFSSWYTVLGVLLFALCYGWSSGRRSVVFQSLALWSVLLLPYAWWVHHLSTGEDNLVLIKGHAELMQVRRTIGSADPLSYLLPLDYRSPDFAVISRYGEQFVHSAYVGLVSFGVFLWRRKEYPLFMVSLAGLGFVLSLGPVLVIQGEPWIWKDHLAIPLPYILLEKFPGFSGLTLLYRLAFVPMLCLALLIPRHWGTRGVLMLAIALLLERGLGSPVRDLPLFTTLPSIENIVELRDAPQGAVGHYPIVGGRENLYVQTIHRKPLAGSLNFPLNGALEKIFRTAVKTEDDPSELLRRVGNVAKQTGLRYLVLDTDPTIMPDHYSKAVKMIQQQFPSVGQDENDYIVLQLW